MDVVHHAFKVREFFIGLNGVKRPSALALPGIVDVDVSPAVLTQAHFYHGIGGGDHFFPIDVACPGVPAIPANGRSEGNGIADFNGQGLGRCAELVFGF